MRKAATILFTIAALTLAACTSNQQITTAPSVSLISHEPQSPLENASHEREDSLPTVTPEEKTKAEPLEFRYYGGIAVLKKDLEQRPEFAELWEDPLTWRLPMLKENYVFPPIIRNKGEKDTVVKESVYRLTMMTTEGIQTVDPITGLPNESRAEFSNATLTLEDGSEKELSGEVKLPKQVKEAILYQVVIDTGTLPFGTHELCVTLKDRWREESLSGCSKLVIAERIVFPGHENKFITSYVTPEGYFVDFEGEAYPLERHEWPHQIKMSPDPHFVLLDVGYWEGMETFLIEKMTKKRLKPPIFMDSVWIPIENGYRIATCAYGGYFSPGINVTDFSPKTQEWTTKNLVDKREPQLCHANEKNIRMLMRIGTAEIPHKEDEKPLQNAPIYEYLGYDIIQETITKTIGPLNMVELFPEYITSNRSNGTKYYDITFITKVEYGTNEEKDAVFDQILQRYGEKQK